MYARDDYKRCVCHYWGEGEKSCPQASAAEVAAANNALANDANNAGNVVVDNNNNNDANQVKVDSGLLAKLMASIGTLETKRDDVDKSVNSFKALVGQVEGVVKME